MLVLCRISIVRPMEEAIRGLALRVVTMILSPMVEVTESEVSITISPRDNLADQFMLHFRFQVVEARVDQLVSTKTLGRSRLL